LTNPFPTRVTFRNVKRSDALEAAIRHWAERLAPLGPEIIACGVVVEALRQGWHRPRLFRVRVELAVPGNDIVARSDTHDEDTARNPYAAVRQAFDAAERQLLDRTGRLRLHTKPGRKPGLWSSEAIEQAGADQ
jgi:ribosome-associated translation inhibitor RaiA